MIVHNNKKYNYNNSKNHNYFYLHSSMNSLVLCEAIEKVNNFVLMHLLAFYLRVACCSTVVASNTWNTEVYKKPFVGRCAVSCGDVAMN